MPRHLIGDAHEWINEIPTVPTHSLAKLQPSQRSWDYLCVVLNLHDVIIAVRLRSPRALADKCLHLHVTLNN